VTSNVRKKSGKLPQPEICCEYKKYYEGEKEENMLRNRILEVGLNLTSQFINQQVQITSMYEVRYTAFND
jgi:hypothetical protein